MARNKKPLPTIEALEITAIAAEGKSIARHGDMVVFIPYGAPGDIADIRLTRKKHSYAEGVIQRMITPSPIRTTPICNHFGACGGCKWQHIPYSKQLEAKQQQVTDTLTRIAKVELPPISSILGSEQQWSYRNKMEYTFSNKKWLTYDQLNSDEHFDDRTALGFHIPGSFDKVLDIEECHLQDHRCNVIRNYLRDYARSKGYTFYDLKAQDGLMRTLMLRITTTGQIMALVIFGKDDPYCITDVLSTLQLRFPEITSLLWSVNTKCNDTFNDLHIKCFHGTEYITEQMEGLTFRIGPKSFYQTNSLQAYELYKVVRNYASLTGNELVYDLYTGTGTIANFVAKQCRHVIGIEYVPEAIADAKVNAEVNALTNTEFYAGDMKDVLIDSFIADHGKPDVIIIDPPRSGMHTDVVEVIKRTAAPRLVYVSCNPATQARDLALLDHMYKVTDVQPVDMFPHTHHVENVVRLELR